MLSIFLRIFFPYRNFKRLQTQNYVVSAASFCKKTALSAFVVVVHDKSQKPYKLSQPRFHVYLYLLLATIIIFIYKVLYF